MKLRSVIRFPIRVAEPEPTSLSRRHNDYERALTQREQDEIWALRYAETMGLTFERKDGTPDDGKWLRFLNRVLKRRDKV